MAYFEPRPQIRYPPPASTRLAFRVNGKSLQSVYCMSATVEQIDLWRSAQREHQRLDFKQAKNQYDYGKLCEYCVALANEGGGKLLRNRGQTAATCRRYESVSGRDCIGGKAIQRGRVPSRY